MEQEFPGNSKSQKEPLRAEEAPKMKRIVHGDVVRRKQPLSRRFKDTFIQGDATSVWSYIGLEVLLPAAKDAISDAFSQGIDRILFGESSRGRSRSRGSRPGHTSYSKVSGNAPWDRGGREDPRDAILSRRARSTHSFDQIELPSRAAADQVLDEMYNALNQYDAVTVADFYDTVGVSKEYTDDYYGWTSLEGTRIERLRGGGYVLDLPKPEPLKRR